MCPPIFSFVPNANFAGAATVTPAVAFAPDAVLPVDFPQHFAHEQYAVILYVSPPITAVDVVATGVLDVSAALDVFVTFF